MSPARHPNSTAVIPEQMDAPLRITQNMKLLSVFALALAMRAQSSSFEVASIKPYRELGGPSSIRTSVGRIRMDNVSLRKLTLWAYGMVSLRSSEGRRTLTGPRWLSVKSD